MQKQIIKLISDDVSRASSAIRSTHLRVPELPLDDPVRVLDLRAHAGLERLDLVENPAQLGTHLHPLAIAWSHSNVPPHGRLRVGALVRAAIARVGEDRVLLTMQQAVRKEGVST